MSDQKSLAKELVEAGVIFGQRRSNWNPKMKPYIFATKNGVSIIDIKETIKGLLLAKKFIAKTVASGKDVCFVGTKRQARGAVEQYCADSKMPYVTERWLGGILTNFRTIRERLRRLEELEKLAETGSIKNYSKKMESQLAREQKKIHRNLNGLRTMGKLPGAIVVVDTTRELNALLEAKSLGIPTICLIDTDGNPDLADIPIPGNDDSMRSIDIIIRWARLRSPPATMPRTPSVPSVVRAGASSAPKAVRAAPPMPRAAKRPRHPASDASKLILSHTNTPTEVTE
ncbi:MAG: 30S ribosomal protein S2 [Proteobacteria bacterium]|nr:30S ribosomal protein S2 [Pseudomonadota bacterium]